MMILSDLLTALASNANVTIKLLDSADAPLITFSADGYKMIESDLGEREVKRIKFQTPSYTSNGLTVLISVEDAADPTPDPDPGP